jgi:predicted Rossmann fold nucleotide-binding protein DprA/Smf involved in DNA uptake
MLLTMAISAKQVEYAHPYTTQEFRRIESLVRETDYHSVGRLFEMDISAMMMMLGFSEEEGYRAYTLLHRDMQLAYMLSNFAKEGIEAVTCYNTDVYPKRLRHKLGKDAPPFYYRCGNAALLGKPAIGIIGIGGVKTTNEVRESIDVLIRGAKAHGYVVATGGEPGVSRVAAKLARHYGVSLIEVVGGGMLEHIHSDGIAELIVSDKCVVLSLEHPDAAFDGTRAIARNKVLFSMTNAAFVFNTDGRRGEFDILQNHYCDWVYAWEGCKANRPLIDRGAIPLRNALEIDFKDMSQRWKSSNSEQLSMFDLL